MPQMTPVPTAPLDDATRLGELLSQSGYFSDARSAAQAAVKVLAGSELGFGPIASMTGIYIVKGNVTLSANLMATVIQRHPDYDFRVKVLTKDRCEIVYFHKGQDVGTSIFTMDDARQAGLAGKENWRTYPRNMLFARAMSNGASFFVPGAFAGPIYAPEEFGVDTDPETGNLLMADVKALSNGNANTTANDTTTATITQIEPTPEPEPQPEPPPPAANIDYNKRTGEVIPPDDDGEPDPAKPSAADPNATIAPEQADMLRELLTRTSATEGQQRMWLLAAGVSLRAAEEPSETVNRVTVAQARSVIDHAQQYLSGSKKG